MSAVFKDLQFPVKVTILPISLKVKLTTSNGHPTALRCTDGLNNKTCYLKGNLKSCIALERNGDVDGYLTITKEKFVTLQQWMWEYDESDYRQPKVALMQGIEPYEGWFTFIGDVDFTKEVRSVTELVDFFDEFLSSGLMINEVLIDGVTVLANIPWNDQGIYNLKSGSPLIDIDGLISNTAKLIPVGRSSSIKTINVGNVAIAEDTPVLRLGELNLFRNYSDPLDFCSCPACGSTTIRKVVDGVSREACDNISCPSITASFIDSMVEQTQLPYDVIMTHFSEGSYFSYKGSLVEQQCHQEVGVDRLRTILDIVGKSHLAEAINYVYPRLDDVPFNTRMDTIDSLLSTHVMSKDDGVHAKLAPNIGKLKVLLLGFDEPHVKFGLEMLLRNLNISITSIIDEASIAFIGYLDNNMDGVDDEFLQFVRESTNVYVYNTLGDTKALMNELKKLRDI